MAASSDGTHPELNVIEGNLLTDIDGGIIIHQVNTLGVTGSLAGALRRRFPAHFKRYAAACPDAKLLGQCIIECPKEETLVMCHVFGQLMPGPRTDMKAVTDALEELFSEINNSPYLRDQQVFAPYKMGCGCGGGNWEKYSSLLYHLFPNIIIVQRPNDKPTEAPQQLHQGV